MKQIWLLMVCSGVLAGYGYAQEPIYRCGNEYTNTKPDGRTKGCKLLEGGNVTVVQGTARTSKAPNATAAPSAQVTAASKPRGDAAQNKARDADARFILQTELKKAQIRQEELKAEYNNGQPEKRGDEARNHQKYLDRVAELKASLTRNESDIAGIRREIDRLPSSTAASPNF